MPHATDVWRNQRKNIFMTIFIHNALKIYAIPQEIYVGIDFIKNN